LIILHRNSPGAFNALALHDTEAPELAGSEQSERPGTSQPRTFARLEGLEHGGSPLTVVEKAIKPLLLHDVVEEKPT